jgi:predicted Zn-dependent peptidase
LSAGSTVDIIEGPGKPVNMNLRKRSSPLLREDVVSATLSCGLQAHVVPKKGFSKKIGIFATRYGSIDLAFTPDGRERLETPPGIAHFLEHQLFKKAGGEDVLMEFGRFGASSNAFTDYTSTAYYFTASGQFDRNLDLLVSFVSQPYFEASNVDKERLIIEQELRMYEDSPDHRLYKNLMRVLYTTHPVRIDIGGEVSDIQQIDRDLLEACYRMFYNPANMVLVMAGDVDPAEAFAVADRALPVERFKAQGPIRRHVPGERPGVKERVVRAQMAVSRPRVIVGFKDLEVGPRRSLQREIESSVLLDLLFGRSSGFYTDHYESGLIDDSFSFSYSAEDEFGFSLIGGETDDPDRLAEAVLMELHKAKRGGVRTSDLERSRRKRLGKFIRAFDSPDASAFMLLGALQRGQDLFEVPQVISKLSPKALAGRLRTHFDERNYAVSILTPKPA